MSESRISFTSTAGPPGFVVEDAIEGRLLRFETADPVRVRPVTHDDFLFPIDAAVEVTTSSLALTRREYVAVWSADGTENDPVTSPDPHAFSGAGRYVEISAPIKLYLQVGGPFSASVDLDRVTLEFPEPTTVVVGARSYHERPSGTITVGDDPRDVMAAISAFSSSLKSTTPDVSFPTLRGHPPRVEVGEDLQIPAHLESPDTGITVEVPPSRRMIYPVASLAFYLGASVEPAETPRIRTSDGFVHPLDDAPWIEDAVADALRRMLLFDAVVRSAGLYGQEVIERETVEPLLDADLETLYGSPIRERVAAYLSVDADDLDAVGPRWVMTAYVPTTVTGATVLPHVVDELAIVRTPRGTRVDERTACSTLGVPEERSRQYVLEGDAPRHLIRPTLVDDSIEPVWFADDVPLGATKGTREALEYALDRPTPTEEIDVAVVTNDPSTDDRENGTDETYALSSEIEASVDRYVDATTGDLASILANGYDLFHFVGETDPDGLVGTDGTLSLEDLTGVDLGAFFLEADHSFEEALFLARNGALGGIGTIGTIPPADRGRIGRLVTGLLTKGFTLRGAIDVARRELDGGERYVVVGNGRIDVAQPESTTPMTLTIEAHSEGFDVTFENHPSGRFGVGSSIYLDIPGVEMYLGPGTGARTVSLSDEETRSLLSRADGLTRYDGDLYWDTHDLVEALGL
ncbi:MAG: hypothetical protein ABEJ77_01750 [Halanaeroarchaeum sp.]